MGYNSVADNTGPSWFV